MFCQKCGNKINEEANFCDKCGSEIDKKTELSNKEEVIESKIINETYNFTKVKQIGALNLLVIKTKVDLNGSLLLIEKNKYYLGLIKGKSRSERINVKEIDTVISKKGIDLIDGIYAIIFTILTIITMNPILLIGAAVCLWTGYGEKIFINTRKKEKIIIYTQGGVLTKELIDFINLNRI